VSTFIERAALVFFILCGSVGAAGLLAWIFTWGVNEWAKARGVHESLCQFIWMKYAHGFKIPEPNGLPYAVQVLREVAELPCTPCPGYPCEGVGHKSACAGCAARFALIGLGLRESAALTAAPTPEEEAWVAEVAEQAKNGGAL